MQLDYKFSQKSQKFVDENYILLDTFYRSDSIEQGRKLKEFLNEFFKRTFLFNCEILPVYCNFPLTSESENSAYASITSALCTLTPYIVSEVNLKYMGIKEGVKDRYIDLWCASLDKKLDLWFEIKKLNEFNITNGQYKLTTKDEKRLKDALEQIIDIKNAEPETSKEYGKYYSVALINIPIRYSGNRKIDEEIIQKAPKKALESLVDITKKYKEENMQILCGVLDFSKEVQKDKNFLEYGGCTTHYSMLCAVILETSKTKK